jgi:ferric-dicitrate binding protein FerR (iron transport regulator)
VVTQGQTVEVLGTHFNINAYQDENSVKTTLLEGRVKVSSGTMNTIIKPGEQAQTDDRTAVINTVQNVDTDQAVAWKDGLFQFKNADLKTVMKDVSRWYNVDIEYEGAISQRKFSGKIYRDISLAQLLEIINYSDIHFHIEKASGEQERSKIIIKP